MWFSRKKSEADAAPVEPQKPAYWVSPFYASWSCSGCDTVINYADASRLKEPPRCCAHCGCDRFVEVIGRERRIAGDDESRGKWFARGIEVPLND